MIDSYGAADFEALIGERFVIAEADGVELTLTNVVRFDRPGQEMFSVFFRGPVAAQMPQAIYSLINETASGGLFLVPIGRFGDEIEYEAAFNRLIKE